MATRGRVLADAGPLIAFLDKGDRRHEDAVSAFTKARGPVLTTWPVLAEACHMLGRISVDAQLDLLAKVADGTLTVEPLEQEDVRRARELMGKYRDRRMDLADATLVALAERDGIDTVVTFDRRDFRVYRAAGIGALKMLP